MSMHASNASMRVSVQVCMYASMSISGTVSVSTLSAIPFVDEYRITTILHPQDRHPNGNTWIGHQGKDHDQDHSTANGQVLHQLLIDDTHLGRGFFFRVGCFFFRGFTRGGRISRVFSEKESFRFGRLRSPWIFWFGLNLYKKRKRFFSGQGRSGQAI